MTKKMTKHERLIDANALIKELHKRQAEPEYQHHGEDWYVGLISAEKLIYESPTIEPESSSGKYEYHYDHTDCI